MRRMLGQGAQISQISTMLGLHRFLVATLFVGTVVLAQATACIEDARLITEDGGNGDSGGGATSQGGAAGGVSGGGGDTPTDCDHCPGTDTTCAYRVCDPCEMENAPAATPCSDMGGTLCNGLGACVECLTTMDCPEMGDMCINGQCGTATGANGDPCVINADCFSGFCSPEGVCCDTACDGLCESCVAMTNCGVDGTCGVVPAGTDPDDECPSGSCFTGTCAEGKVVFVTSMGYKGNLGGLTGADALCNTHATAACMTGNFMAWLSSAQGSPDTRFTPSTIPYRLVSGAIVATSYNDLTDNSIATPINLTEVGGVPPSSPVGCPTQQMSYSATDGTGAAVHPNEDCSDWTVTTGHASWGYNTVTNANWSLGCYGSGGDTCNADATLYCFEQ